MLLACGIVVAGAGASVGSSQSPVPEERSGRVEGGWQWWCLLCRKSLSLRSQGVESWKVEESCSGRKGQGGAVVDKEAGGLVRLLDGLVGQLVRSGLERVIMSRNVAGSAAGSLMGRQNMLSPGGDSGRSSKIGLGQHLWQGSQLEHSQPASKV